MAPFLHQIQGIRVTVVHAARTVIFCVAPHLPMGAAVQEAWVVSHGDGCTHLFVRPPVPWKTTAEDRHGLIIEAKGSDHPEVSFF